MADATPLRHVFDVSSNPISCQICREEAEADAKLEVPKAPKKKTPEKHIIDLCERIVCGKVSEKSQHMEHVQTASEIPQTCEYQKMDTLTCVPTEEKEYRKEFQFSVANGLTLKPYIKESLTSVRGVDAVCLGFSTKKEVGHWPVIRVYPDKKTCKRIEDRSTKEEFMKKLSIALQKSVSLSEPTKRFSDECSYEEFANMIEVVVCPTKVLELQSSALGEEVKTTYTSHNCDNQRLVTWTQKGTMTCCVKNSIRIGGECDYVAHYLISGLHPVIPSNSRQFRSMLPPLPNVPGCQQVADDDVPVMYEWIDHIRPNSYCPAKGPANNPYQMPCQLQATFFPYQAKVAFQKMTDRHQYQCIINTFPDQGAEPKVTKFLFGKSGLIRNNAQDMTYTHVLKREAANDDTLNDDELPSSVRNIPFRSHPCNVDIAVFKNTQQHCSVEESFENLHSAKEAGIRLPDKIKWCGPPGDRLEDWVGSVVFIKEGRVYKLSDRMIEFNPDYPGCIWLPTPSIDRQIAQGDSGAPVFLWNKNNMFHLIGSLITKEHASPIYFSLQAVAVEIALNHFEQILDEIDQQPYYYDAVQPGEEEPEQDLADLITKTECLRQYTELLELFKKRQHLVTSLRLPKLKYSELMNKTLPNDNYIESDLRVCYYPS